LAKFGEKEKIKIKKEKIKWFWRFAITINEIFFLQKSLDFYTWFSMYSKNIEGWLNVCTSSQIWLSIPIDDSHLSYKQCALLAGGLITHWIAKNKANVNEIWWFEGRGVKSPKLKSLEHTIAYGWQLFHPCTNNFQCMKVCNLLFFSSQMKSVQKKIHSLNVHCTTHGQDPHIKKEKNPTTMGISKFNLRSKVACTWE
jgi:hypothetical protein